MPARKDVANRGLLVISLSRVPSDHHRVRFPDCDIAMTRLLQRLIAVFLFISAAAHAAPDPTGYWYNPNESGWGAAIAQQGDALFVSLLVYDEQKRPAWFVASNVRDSGGGTFSGSLYRASGPWFAGAFDPAVVQAQSVGALSVQTTGLASLRLTYTVNGIEVTKSVARMTWDSNAERLAGAYFGGMSVALAFLPQASGCASAPTFFPPGTAFTMSTSTSMSAPSTVVIVFVEGTDLLTAIGGPYQQVGQIGAIASGAIFRGNIVSPPRIADAQITNLVVSDDGFSGHIRITMGNCIYEGAIGGIRRAP